MIRIPGLAAFRDAARLALLGLVGAALLAGNAVDWLSRHARALIVAVAALAVLEAGWSGSPGPGAMPTTLAALDRPIAADRSGSIVLDLPFGLRGGMPLYGSRLANAPLLIATADGHPRAIAYISRLPESELAAVRRHPFYADLLAAQQTPSSLYRELFGAGRADAARLAAARQDARRMDIGWVIVWSSTPVILHYLTAVGFRFDYRADGAAVYRITPPVSPRG